MQKVRDSYTSLAVILLTAFLLLILINAGFLGMSALRRTLQPDPGPIWKYGWQPVLASYPGWSKGEIVALLRGVYFEGAIEYEEFTEFRERPRRTKYVTVDPAGFRVGKNQGGWPPDPACTNVFIFGGSTTFGYGVTDEETIPSWLQERASANTHGKPIRVYNFGRGYYFSSQEAALFNRFLLQKVVPDVAVFVDGLNEFVYPDDKPEYTDTLRSFMDGRQPPQFLVKSPMMRAARFVSERFLHPTHAAVAQEPDSAAAAATVIARWLRSRQIIQSASDSFGIRAVFVWQPVPTYHYDLRYNPFAKGNFGEYGQHELSRAGYESMDQIRKARDLGDNFLWLGDIQEQRAENLYVDLLHYNSAFAREIANRICDFMQQRGALPQDQPLGRNRKSF